MSLLTKSFWEFLIWVFEENYQRSKNFFLKSNEILQEVRYESKCLFCFSDHIKLLRFEMILIVVNNVFYYLINGVSYKSSWPGNLSICCTKYLTEWLWAMDTILLSLVSLFFKFTFSSFKLAGPNIWYSDYRNGPSWKQIWKTWNDNDSRLPQRVIKIGGFNPIGNLPCLKYFSTRSRDVTTQSN